MLITALDEHGNYVLYYAPQWLEVPNEIKRGTGPHQICSIFGKCRRCVEVGATTRRVVFVACGACVLQYPTGADLAVWGKLEQCRLRSFARQLGRTVSFVRQLGNKGGGITSARGPSAFSADLRVCVRRFVSLFLAGCGLVGLWKAGLLDVTRRSATTRWRCSPAGAVGRAATTAACLRPGCRKRGRQQDGRGADGVRLCQRSSTTVAPGAGLRPESVFGFNTSCPRTTSGSWTPGSWRRWATAAMGLADTSTDWSKTTSRLPTGSSGPDRGRRAWPRCPPPQNTKFGFGGNEGAPPLSRTLW